MQNFFFLLGKGKQILLKKYHSPTGIFFSPYCIAVHVLGTGEHTGSSSVFIEELESSGKMRSFCSSIDFFFAKWVRWRHQLQAIMFKFSVDARDENCAAHMRIIWYRSGRQLIDSGR